MANPSVTHLASPTHPTLARTRLTAATEAIRQLTTPAGAEPTVVCETAPAGFAPRPAGLTPSEATRTRYAALAGCPDLSDHAQLVEAIGYAERARRLSRRQKWTRVERVAIDAAVAYVQADAMQSLERALAIWSEIATARGMQMLSDAQDAALAAEGRVAA